MTIAAEKTSASVYSDAQVGIITGFKGTGVDGKLCFKDCETIAAMPEMFLDGEARKPRGIAAKIARMGLPYAKKEKARKDGSPVETKTTLVKEISALTALSFAALDKAGREDLVSLRDYIAKLAA